MYLLRAFQAGEKLQRRWGLLPTNKVRTLFLRGKKSQKATHPPNWSSSPSRGKLCPESRSQTSNRSSPLLSLERPSLTKGRWSRMVTPSLVTPITGILATRSRTWCFESRPEMSEDKALLRVGLTFHSVVQQRPTSTCPEPAI